MFLFYLSNCSITVCHAILQHPYEVGTYYCFSDEDAESRSFINLPKVTWIKPVSLKSEPRAQMPECALLAPELKCLLTSCPPSFSTEVTPVSRPFSLNYDDVTTATYLCLLLPNSRCSYRAIPGDASLQGPNLGMQRQKAVCFPKVSDVKERWHPLVREHRNWSQISWSQIPAHW